MSFLKDNDRLMSILVHLFILTNVFPGLGLIANFVILHFARKESYLLAENARAALNFQLSMIILSVLIAILTFISFGLLGFLGILATAFVTIMAVLGAIQASNGIVIRYPLTIQFIR